MAALYPPCCLTFFHPPLGFDSCPIFCFLKEMSYHQRRIPKRPHRVRVMGWSWMGATAEDAQGHTRPFCAQLSWGWNMGWCVDFLLSNFHRQRTGGCSFQVNLAGTAAGADAMISLFPRASQVYVISLLKEAPESWAYLVTWCYCPVPE